MTIKPWRQEIEILQSYSKHKAFTYTTTSANSETAIDLGLAMEEVNKISFVVELADAYVEFDGDASATTMLIPQDEGYFDDAIYISNKITIMRAGSTNARIRGIAWGR
jgi:uncharacterized protein YpmS